MLSSGLYSDKIGAVLREIGCNASDAHIEIGNPGMPFEVKLPNRIDKLFHIRDWGPGLSHDDVMTLYTTYFASTKQTSNDFTGAFGLGSKSPFSYTDNFSVVSVFDGQKRTYGAYIGEDGLPTISLLASDAADKGWEHGIMVSFPVKPDDFPEFAGKARSIFQWFRVKPTILGAPAVTGSEATIDTPLFRKFKELHGTHVLMGNVRYPLKQALLEKLAPKGAVVFQFDGVVINLHIGEAQVAASREDLQYDKDTISTVSKKCTAVADVLLTEVRQVVSDYKKLDWKAKCATGVTVARWDTSRWFSWDNVLQNAGMSAAEASEANRVLTTSTVQLPADMGESTLFRIMKEHTRAGKVSHTVVEDGKLKTRNGYSQGTTAYLEKVENTKIFYGKTKHILIRARKAILDKTVHQLILVSPRVGDSDALAKAEATLLQSAFPGMELAPSDDLPPSPIVAGLPGIRSPRKKKGATPTPLPTSQFIYVDSAGNVDREDISLSIPGNQLFMCQGRYFGHSQSNLHGYLRVFKNTLKDDTRLEAPALHNMWNLFQTLQGLVKVGLNVMGYFILTADEVRGLDIPKRGWKSTYQVMQEWTQDKAVVDAIAAKIKRWRPVVELDKDYATYPTFNDDWGPYLVNMKNSHPKRFDLISASLAKHNLLQPLDEILTASKAPGAQRRQTPAILDQYERLAVSLGINLTTVGHTRSYFTIASVDEDIKKLFPLAKFVEPGQMNNILESSKSLGEGYLQYVFTT
jgi:hypothetical protein